MELETPSVHRRHKNIFVTIFSSIAVAPLLAASIGACWSGALKTVPQMLAMAFFSMFLLAAPAQLALGHRHGWLLPILALSLGFSIVFAGVLIQQIAIVVAGSLLAIGSRTVIVRGKTWLLISWK